MGTSIPPEGGSGGAAPAALWYNTTAAWAQTLIPTLTVGAFSSECWSLNVGEWELNTAIGTGAVTVLNSSQGGVFKVASGVTANSSQILRNKDHSNASLIPNQKTSKYAVIGLARIGATAATFELDMVGISDGSSTQIILGAFQAISATNWCAYVGTGPAVDTTVAFDTNWHTLAFIADGTHVTFYVGAQDGTGMTQVGSQQAQSACSTNPSYFSTLAQNLATAANVEHHLDSVLVLTERATNSM